MQAMAIRFGEGACGRVFTRGMASPPASRVQCHAASRDDRTNPRGVTVAGGEDYSHSLGCHDESGKSIGTGKLSLWRGSKGSRGSAAVASRVRETVGEDGWREMELRMEEGVWRGEKREEGRKRRRNKIWKVRERRRRRAGRALRHPAARGVPGTASRPVMVGLPWGGAQEQSAPMDEALKQLDTWGYTLLLLQRSPRWEHPLQRRRPGMPCFASATLPGAAPRDAAGHGGDGGAAGGGAAQRPVRPQVKAERTPGVHTPSPSRASHGRRCRLLERPPGRP